jgi:hypothetical protein
LHFFVVLVYLDDVRAGILEGMSALQVSFDVAVYLLERQAESGAVGIVNPQEG